MIEDINDISVKPEVGNSTKPMLAEVHPIEGLLHLVVKNNGNIQMPKTLFPNSWQIDSIRGVYFDEEFDIEQNDETSLKWNAYVGRIRSAIGVHTYCEWVRNKERNIIGILAFYNPIGEEIKVKHFKKWNELLKCVQLHFC